MQSRVIWRVIATLALASTATAAAVAGPSPAGSAPAGKGPLSAPLTRLAEGRQAGRSAPVDGIVDAAGPEDPSADGPGTLIETPDGYLVQAFSDAVDDALVARLDAAGAEVTHVDRDLDIVTLAAQPDELRRISQVAGVRYVREVLEPARSGVLESTSAAGLSAVSPPCGAATSEGDVQLDAIGLRQAWDTEGVGVEVGILSDTWNRNTTDATSANQDIASGDIPGPANPCPGPGRTTAVSIVAEGPAGGAIDEGRAMGQIVHDLAPAANLSFATAFTGDTQFANNIRTLRNQGAHVIVDDVFYFNEPVYQNGPIGVAVADVVADGASYFSAIGNENETIGGRPVGSYEAPAFRPTACPAPLTGQCHDFNPGAGVDTTFGFTIPAGGGLRQALHWAEPWRGVTTDLDLHVFVGGQRVLSSTDDNPNGSRQPFEYVESLAQQQANVDIVVERAAGTATPRFKLLHIRSDLSGAEYTQGSGGDVMGPNTSGHPVVPGAGGVGAVRYDNPNAPEAFSNRGPSTWYFGPVIGSTPAAPLPQPLVIPKPDLAATDGGRTTFFFDDTAPFQNPRFFGTSASAPHAAAVAALLLDCNSSLTNAQILSTLTGTASPVSGGVPANVGAGLVDARAAGDAVCLTPPPGPSFSVSDVAVAEGNGGLSGQKTATFTVTLSAPLTTTASVKYATANGTAIAPGDFTARALTTLQFNPGQTSKAVIVQLRGDTVVEPDETFVLNLSAPVGAAIVDGQGVATILNDDVPPVVPSVSIADASVTEGPASLFGKTMTFTVTLSAPAAGPTSVMYRTIDGSAVAPGDYQAKPNTVLNFAKGQTSKTIQITIRGDAVVEPDELFFILLTNPVGLTLGDAGAMGTIVNDD